MPRRITPTVTEAVAEFQETREPKVAATTHANDWSILRAFVRAMGPNKQVHTLTQRQVEIWFAAEAKRQRASSYNKVRTRIKGFVGFTVRRGWVTVDLMGEVGTLKVVKETRLQLTAYELLDLPNHTNNERDRAFLTLACNTALRANELCSLRVGDVDLSSGWLDTHITKSAIEDRMPISSELDAALRIWLQEYEKDAGELQPDWYLFPRREPGAGRYIRGESLGTQYVGHVYGSLIPNEPLMNAAEVAKRAMRSQGHRVDGKREGCHTIRRSVARAYFDARAAAGYDGALRETAALLHHKHSHTTEDYLGLSTEKLGRDKALRGKPFLSAMISTENVTPIRATGLG